jgi:hypothetical protein
MVSVIRYADVDDIAARNFDEDVIEARDSVDIYRRILQDIHFQAREHVRAKLRPAVRFAIDPGFYQADNIERALEHFEHVGSRGLFSKSS